MLSSKQTISKQLPVLQNEEMSQGRNEKRRWGSHCRLFSFHFSSLSCRIWTQWGKEFSIVNKHAENIWDERRIQFNSLDASCPSLLLCSNQIYTKLDNFETFTPSRVAFHDPFWIARSGSSIFKSASQKQNFWGAL